MFSFNTLVTVDANKVANMLVTAFESAHCSWLGPVTAGPGLPGGHAWYSEAANLELENWCFTARFDGEDDPEGSFASTANVDRAALTKALIQMAVDYPTAFNDLQHDNDDAETADVFLQLLLLGDVVYG